VQAYAPGSYRIVRLDPSIKIPRVASPAVTIDGDVEAMEWVGAWVSGVPFPSGYGDDPIECEIRMLHDGSFLYVAVSTPMASGWDCKLRLRIDGNASLDLDGSKSPPYTDIQVEKGAPGAWSGYTNYVALLGFASYEYVTAGASEARASSGTTAVSWEFKVPLTDLGLVAPTNIRIAITASADASSMWYWPVVDQAEAGGGDPEHPDVWALLTLDD
jgi:hypothetical protein